MGKPNVPTTTKLQKLWICRKLLIVLLTPLLLLPLILHPTATKASRCGYVMCLMGIYWGTEAIPIAITGIIPIFLLPMLDLLPAKHVCSKYMQDTVLMFFGGIILAVAVEKVNLHKRIALNVLLLFGTNYKNLITGFGVCTWFLSMWLSNTATLTLILPIVEAILHQIQDLEMTELDRVEMEHFDVNEESMVIQMGDNSSRVNEGSGKTSEECDVSDKKPNYQMSASLVSLGKAITLCCGYSAKIGGLAMLTGTPPNLIIKSFMDDLWLSHGRTDCPLTFATWTLYALPASLLFTILVIVWLQVFYLGPRALLSKCNKNEESKEIEQILRREKESLGHMRYEEIVTLVLLALLVSLWFFLDPGFIVGWKALFSPGYMSGAVPSMIVALLVFIIPNELTFSKGKITPIMDWATVKEKVPWMVIFIFGGGSALADAALQSGLSSWIGSKLLLFASLPNWVMLGLICLIAAFVTEIMMNTAAIIILLPIVTSLGENIGMNPLYFAFPVALAAQFAFMLPTSSISTTLIASTGRVTVTDMMKAGCILNFIGTVVVLLASHTWGMVFFDLVQIPWMDGLDNMTVNAEISNRTDLVL